jgi:hypothetical protein
LHETPNALISATVSSATALLLTYVNAIFAPSLANFNAMALPIPRVPPVIRATFPSNNFMLVLFLLLMTAKGDFRCEDTLFLQTTERLWVNNSARLR